MEPPRISTSGENCRNVLGGVKSPPPGRNRVKIVDQVKDDDDGLDQVVIGNGAGATEFVHVLSEQS